MKTQKNILVFASILALNLVLLAGLSSAATIFSDDFNDGDLNGWTVTNWTNAGNNVESSDAADTVLSRTISTSGFQTIVVKYSRQLEGNWEPQDLFKVSWSTDGSTFTTLENVIGLTADEDPGFPGETSFVSKTFGIPSSANNNANFRLRFECTTNTADEICNVDNVIVEGTAITGGNNNSTDGFCSAGEKGGRLEIKDIKIDNNGEGTDDEWQLLDEIEVQVEVENSANDDVDDVFIELGFFDSSGDNIVSDLDFDSTDEEEADIGNINDGDEETYTFTFRVPADIEDGSYKLRVKAYSDDFGEDEECTDTSSDFDQDNYQSVDVERETDEEKFIAFENVETNSLEYTCGDLVSLSTDVFNIGDEDQDQVLITLFNNELNIKETYEIRSDLDQGDDESVSFSFTLPQNAQNKVYNFELLAEYDYRNNLYREKLETTAKVPVKVIGCSTSGSGSGSGSGNVPDRFAAISATLDSSAEAGKELVVRTTITNLLSEDANLVVGVDGYQDWATLGGISERILSGVDAGESKEITVRLNVNEDAAGEQSFTIEVANGAMSETREVVVNLKEATAPSGGFNLGDNAYLWIIGVINVVLIILIIVVAVRISRR